MNNKKDIKKKNTDVKNDIKKKDTDLKEKDIEKKKDKDIKKKDTDLKNKDIKKKDTVIKKSIFDLAEADHTKDNKSDTNNIIDKKLDQKSVKNNKLDQKSNKKIDENSTDNKEKTPFDNFTIKEANKNNKESKKHKRNHDIKNGIKKPKIEVKEIENIEEKKDKKEVKKDKKVVKKDKKEVKKDKKDIKKEVKKVKKEENNNKKLDKKDDKEQIGVKLTKLETEILHKGTIKDKINLLTLIVEKNPSDFNYKNLLFYTENQRNDIIYMTLKNLKDLLISKGVPKTNYIKQRITKCFDINVRNTFIKTKVLRLVYELLKNNILFLDLIYIFINKIGDKKDLETYVRENLMTLFTINEEAVLYNVEDFIYKNMSFKCINSILKFLGSVAPSDKNKMIELYKIILDNIHEYKDEQKNIILENSLDQLCSLLEDIENPSDFVDDQTENIILSSYSTDKIAFSGLRILYIIKSKNLKLFIVKLIKNHIFIRSKKIKEIFNMIVKIYKTDKDDKFIKDIFNSSVFYRKDFLISILSVLIKNKVSGLYLLDIIKNHYSNIVRKMVDSLIRKEYDAVEVDPFDKIQLEAYEDILK